MTDRFLEGRVALVTGASRGIGAATAEALGAAGAHVVLTARTGDALEQVEDRIHAAGGTATIAPLDLTEHDGIAKLAAAIASAVAAPIPRLAPVTSASLPSRNLSVMRAP